MEAISIVKIILFSCALFNYSIAERDEPVCYSNFDFHEKVLEKQVRVEHNMKAWEERINSIADRSREQKESMQTMVETFRSDMNHMTEALAKMEQKQDDVIRAVVDREIRMSQELNNTLETVMKDVKNISATPPSAFMTYGLSTNPGDGETIIFTNVLLNLGEGYDPTTGIFTAHTPGVYQFSVQIYVTHAGIKTIYVEMRKNSATVVCSFYEHGDSEMDSVTAVAVVQLEAGDTVSVVRTGGSASSIYVGNTRIRNSFSGTLVTVIQ